MPTVLVALVVLAVLLSAAGPPTAAEEQRLSPQAQRMKDCSAEAKERALAGDARKQFMSECLKGGASRTDPTSQGSASPSPTGASSGPNR